MKRLFILLAAVVMAVSVMAQSWLRVDDVKGDLNAYKYYYVAPTSPITSSSGEAVAVRIGLFTGVAGNQTSSVSPSETISGYLMKSGFNVIASVVPELADQTLIVSYGYTGLGRYHTSGIIIQMRDAKTQELVASFEAEGYGDSGNEAVGITRAIYKALDWFTYHINPEIVYKVIDEYRNYIYLDFYNYTPSHVSQVTLFVSYYNKDGELVHEQEVGVATNINPSEQQRIYFKRPKEFRSKKLKIRYNVISYK